MLKEHGIVNVRPLVGGLDAWIDEGFETERVVVQSDESEAGVS
jgi:3-mercaptopyruvate sulfurtransferase SseA